MAHGHEDYGPGAPTSTVYAVLDMAELAARLGSINVFDRRGNVLFLEDFNGSLAKCFHGTTGTGASVSISNAKARFGNFSCRLVTGDATDNEAYVGAYLSFPVFSKLGFEFSWCPQSWLRDIELDMYVYDGAKYWRPTVRWHEDNDSWQYRDDSNVFVTLTPPVLYAREAYTFNFAKLVVDLDAKEYVRLIANNQSWDLTGKGIYSDANTNAPRLVFYISIYTRADHNCTTYLGHMIVTQNEP